MARIYNVLKEFGGRLPSLFDYGRNVDILLHIDKTSFSGCDYGDDEHFSGHASNGSISLYDLHGG